MKPRTRARRTALQALYEIDIVGHPPEKVLQERIEEAGLENSLADFVRCIVLGVLPLVTELDSIIAQYAPEWPLDQVSIIDRNILRIALWEITLGEQTPLKVAINEAVEISKAYGSDSTPRFVNGVLGSLATKQHEIQKMLQSVKQKGA